MARVAKYNPKRDMLFWWMGNVEGGGNHFQALIVEDHGIAVQLDRNTGKYFEWPMDVAPGLKRQFREDGWKVADDPTGRHFAVLGDDHKSWGFEQLRRFAGELLGDEGKCSVLWITGVEA